MNKNALPYPVINDSNMFCRRRKIILISITIAFLIVTIPHLYYHLTWEMKEAVTNSSDEQGEASSSEDRDVAVIILAYHRTGSSLTGEILSLADQASYFFEPVYYTKMVMSDPSTDAQLFILRAMIECDGDIMSTVLSDSSVSIIRKLDSQMVKKNHGMTAKDLRQMCLQSPIRIIKTIRLRMPTVQTLISDLEASSINMPEVKIIHLVRDPRAMLTSLSKVDTWGGAENNPTHQCNLLTADLKAGRNLPKSQYILLRYEDLAAKPKFTARRLFEFMGVEEPTERLHKYLDEHMHAEKHVNMLPQAGHYFLTVRNSSFDPNHWQKEATPEFVAQVEKVCQWPLAELGYQSIAPKTVKKTSPPLNAST